MFFLEVPIDNPEENEGNKLYIIIVCLNTS